MIERILTKVIELILILGIDFIIWVDPLLLVFTLG